MTYDEASEYLGVSVEEIQHQIRLLHGAIDRVERNGDTLMGCSLEDWTYAELLDTYIQWLKLLNAVNPILGDAFYQVSWWKKNLEHPAWYEVLNRIPYVI